MSIEEKDFTKAKHAFQIYLRDFDTKDDKIALKVAHTMRVVQVAEEISTKMNLDKEDVLLAKFIGLLHDIGRFVQLKETGSFDDSIVPHAVLSNRILFDEGKIRNFIETDEYDNIMYESIKNHGVFKPDEILTGRELLHSKIIRDADKIDNFHTKLIEDIPTMLDVTMEELCMEDISEYAYNTFAAHEPLLNAKRETHLDMWISYIAYIYDLNFKESLEIVREHDYANRLFERVNCKNENTYRKMGELSEIMEKYLQEKSCDAVK
ncbi:MAG: HD domain-containing protein [Lachnospiraceae bacterium]|nr:HD domain-containing protein [Lachnospiraceae bacterium]